MQAPNVPETLSSRVTLRTRWCDEDNQDVLNNAIYMTLFEEGRRAYFDELGQLEDNRFPFLLGQTNVRFLSPGRGGFEVSLELGTTHLGRTSFVQAYRLRGPDGTVWAEAEALLVCYDPSTGASQPMSGAFRAAIAAREGLA
ncbi:MAG: thioesterase family protein [Planctomycetota bacterium]|nr:thioesterase family protein [Planctomycetota bacterium]